MLRTHLDPEHTRFEPWATQIMAHNISLRDTKSFMTDKQLRVQLEIMLDPELQITAHEKKTNEINDLQEWMTQIMEIDNKCQKEMKRINLLINTRVDVATTWAAKCQNTGQSTALHPATQYTNS